MTHIKGCERKNLTLCNFVFAISWLDSNGTMGEIMGGRKKNLDVEQGYQLWLAVSGWVRLCLAVIGAKKVERGNNVPRNFLSWQKYVGRLLKFS